jgi:hypothetical protein
MKKTMVHLAVVLVLTGASATGRAQFLNKLANSFTKGLAGKSTGSNANGGSNARRRRQRTAR